MTNGGLSGEPRSRRKLIKSISALAGSAALFGGDVGPVGAMAKSNVQYQAE